MCNIINIYIHIYIYIIRAGIVYQPLLRSYKYIQLYRYICKVIQCHTCKAIISLSLYIYIYVIIYIHIYIERDNDIHNKNTVVAASSFHMNGDSVLSHFGE